MIYPYEATSQFITQLLYLLSYLLAVHLYRCRYCCKFAFHLESDLATGSTDDGNIINSIEY
ncbi:hypothetical protein ACI65C_000384 [Semiaphis heraclei]